MTVESASSTVRAVMHRENDGVSWELHPEFDPALDAVLRSPGQIVKESPVKRVTRHRLGDSVYYIKRYLHDAVPLRPLKFLFKPTQARQEWRLAALLEARGIPIVRHLAVGERRNWAGVHESILITEGFDGAQLDETRGVNPAAVLAFVQRMHARGVLQADLHPANLLVHRSTQELRLVDLHGTVVRSRLSSVEQRKNLAVLRSYLAIQVPADVERLSVEGRRLRLHQRAYRCLRHNRDFGPRRAGGLKWQVCLARLNPEAEQILRAPDRFLATAPLRLKRGRSSTVAAGSGLVLKRYNFRRLTRLFKDLFRRSPAVNSFLKAYHLELLGLATARPVAAAEKRFGPFLVRSYFLMEKVEGAVSLEDRLKSVGVGEAALVRSVADLIGRLHEEGLTHRDLKASNLLFDAAGRPHLIDLDGLRFVGEVPDARAAADLERLARGAAQARALSQLDRTRFLRAYCRARGRRRVPRTAR